jgi:hypothetical protein
MEILQELNYKVIGFSILQFFVPLFFPRSLFSGYKFRSGDERNRGWFDFR